MELYGEKPTTIQLYSDMEEIPNEKLNSVIKSTIASLNFNQLFCIFFYLEEN